MLNKRERFKDLGGGHFVGNLNDMRWWLCHKTSYLQEIYEGKKNVYVKMIG